MIAGLLKRFGYVRAVPSGAEKAGDIGLTYGEMFRMGYPLHGYGDMAMKVSAQSACVRLISGNVAKLPLPAYRLDGDERERDRDHPLDRVLNSKPNGWQTAFEFRRMLTAHVALYGNGYALKQRRGAEIVGLVPLDACRMQVKQDDYSAPPVYEYSAQRGGRRIYSTEEILHLRDLTLDGVVGLSRMEQARQGILLSYAAETYATAHFMNGADPGVAIEVSGTLSDAQRQQIRASWVESHGGPDRAHRPMVLEGGMKITRGVATNKDSQFLELRSFQVEDIARQYGVPPHLIGLTEKQTSWGTGVEQMALGFLQFHLLDWLVMWETAIKRDLIGEFEPDVFVEHKVEGLLRADFKSRMEGLQIAIQNGILSPNEARQLENRPPRKDGLGDRYWRPSNMAEAGQTAPAEEMPEAATLPGLRRRHVWRTRALAAVRALRSRKVEEAA